MKDFTDFKNANKDLFDFTKDEIKEAREFLKNVPKFPVKLKVESIRRGRPSTCDEILEDQRKERKMNKIDVIMQITHQMEMVVQDMENDAKAFDGKPFNGRTVGEYFGYHGAAIAAIATAIKSICETLEVE